MTNEEMVPKAKLVELAALFGKLEEARRKEKGLIAEMIRACLFWLEVDVTTYRVRGHETFGDRQKIVTENRENKAKAKLYLQHLATKLEDESVSGNLTQSTEGEATCISPE